MKKTLKDYLAYCENRGLSPRLVRAVINQHGDWDAPAGGHCTYRQKERKHEQSVQTERTGNGQTRGGTQWGPGVSHSGTGEGELCGPGWIHAYEHPLIAVLMNPIHANFQTPRLWEAEGEVGLRDGQLKCGCKTLTTVREIPLPAVTTEMRVRFAILCAKEVCACLSWNAWADRWLSGEDRSEAAAGAAAEAASTPARAAQAAAGAAQARRLRLGLLRRRRGRRMLAWAAYAAEAAAAAAAAGHGIDIFKIAEKACSGLR
jgi:hypothetical protein